MQIAEDMAKLNAASAQRALEESAETKRAHEATFDVATFLLDLAGVSDETNAAAKHGRDDDDSPGCLIMGAFCLNLISVKQALTGQGYIIQYMYIYMCGEEINWMRPLVELQKLAARSRLQLSCL